jgi:DNA repair exonuclease SbcCD ATPase subunit
MKLKLVMFSILKSFTRLALIIFVIAGIVAMVAGPQRMQAMAQQVHTEISQAIDSQIDDPVALRSQLRELESEYPKKISQVRNDLAELNGQIQLLEREKAVAERVVELANRDAEGFSVALSQSSQSISSRARTASTHYVSSAALSRTRARAAQAQNVALTYAERAQEATRELGYLYQQAERMEELLAQLESERAQFQAQLLQLERQVDAVARNERLINLMEKRNRTIEQMSRYEAGSLENLQGRLDSIRNRQEAELEVLSNAQNSVSYEDRAKLEMNGMQIPLQDLSQELPESAPIEIGTRF